MDIKAEFNIEKNQIFISQEIVYKNTSNDSLKSIYLNDWSHSYSTKNTPLAKRFSEEYSTKFHFAKNGERGFTVITTLTNSNNTPLFFERLLEHPDVIKVNLAKLLTIPLQLLTSLIYLCRK